MAATARRPCFWRRQKTRPGVGLGDRASFSLVRRWHGGEVVEEGAGWVGEGGRARRPPTLVLTAVHAWTRHCHCHRTEPTWPGGRVLSKHEGGLAGLASQLTRTQEPRHVMSSPGGQGRAGKDAGCHWAWWTRVEGRVAQGFREQVAEVRIGSVASESDSYWDHR